MNEKKTTSITFRISPELKDFIGVIAARESRNLSLQIEYFIKTGIRQYVDKNEDLQAYYDRAFESAPPDARE